MGALCSCNVPDMIMLCNLLEVDVCADREINSANCANDGSARGTGPAGQYSCKELAKGRFSEPAPSLLKASDQSRLMTCRRILLVATRMRSIDCRRPSADRMRCRASPRRMSFLMSPNT